LAESIHRLALRIAEGAGSPWAVLSVAILLVLAGVAGVLVGLSDDWRWAISLMGTAVTLLMIFILQSSQNRHTKAIQLKLDELLRGVEGPRARFMDVEDLTQEELDGLEDDLRERQRESNDAA
jgi:low affinity Fe/Cu permease